MLLDWRSSVSDSDMMCTKTLLDRIPSDVSLMVYRLVHQSLLDELNQEYKSNYYEWIGITMREKLTSSYFYDDDIDMDEYNSTELEYDSDGTDTRLTIHCQRGYAECIYRRRRLDNTVLDDKIDSLLGKYPKMRYEFEHLESGDLNKCEDFHDMNYNYRDLNHNQNCNYGRCLEYMHKHIQPIDIRLPQKYIYSSGVCECECCDNK